MAVQAFVRASTCQHTAAPSGCAGTVGLDGRGSVVGILACFVKSTAIAKSPAAWLACCGNELATCMQPAKHCCPAVGTVCQLLPCSRHSISTGGPSSLELTFVRASLVDSFCACSSSSLAALS